MGFCQKVMNSETTTVLRQGYVCLSRKIQEPVFLKDSSLQAEKRPGSFPRARAAIPATVGQLYGGGEREEGEEKEPRRLPWRRGECALHHSTPSTTSSLDPSPTR